MPDVTTQGVEQDLASFIDPARVRTGVLVVAIVTTTLALTASFVAGTTGSVAYVVALCTCALVTLVVAMEHPHQARAWRLVGAGMTLWAVGGFLLVLQQDAGFGSIPTLVVLLAHTLGYLPLLLGIGELCDPHLRVRHLTAAVDGVLLFLALYAVLWLLVVEPVAVNSSLPKLDRAFGVVYPAGDLAVVMLTFRLITARTARQRVGVLLHAGAVLITAADIGILALHLRSADGDSAITDLAYLLGLSAFALASVWSLLPAPPPVPARANSSRRLARLVAVSSLLPPLVLGAVVMFTDREVGLGPVAIWMLLIVGAAVLRHVASVRELEQAHEQSLWLASHDLSTNLLHRSAFLHEVSEGSLRERSGTVLVVEVLRLGELRDARGHDAEDFVFATVAARVRAAVGENAIVARLAHDQVAAFMRAADLARGRQVATSLQHSLAAGVAWRDVQLNLPVVIGVAQADGAVIDVLGGVRRAAGAARLGRNSGPGFIAIDADLTGSVATRSIVHSGRRDTAMN